MLLTVQNISPQALKYMLLLLIEHESFAWP